MKRMLMIIGVCVMVVAFATAGFAADAVNTKTEDVKKAGDAKVEKSAKTDKAKASKSVVKKAKKAKKAKKTNKNVKPMDETGKKQG